MSRSAGILKSSAGVAAATLLSRVLGLLRVMLEARVLGGGAVAGAWFLAFSIPNLFRRLLGEGALGTALIPVVTHTEEQEGVEQVRRDLGVVFAVLSAILALVVIVGSAGAWILRHAALETGFGSRFPLLATERVQLVLALLPLLMPYAFFICLIGVIGAVLNTRRQFVLPALGSLLLNFFLIGGLCLGYWRGVALSELPLFLNDLSILVLVSGALQLVLMVFLLWRYGRLPRLSREAFRNSRVLAQLWKLVLPGMIGGAALQISFLVDRVLALWIGPQAIPALTNVDRLIDLPIGIFAVSLGSVLMANMARSAAKGDRGALAADLVFSLRHVYFVCVPLALLVICFWEPIMRMLCLGGNYTVEDLEATRMVAIFYGAGIPSFCALKVVLPVFYARKEMRFPLYSSLISVATNIALNLLLMWHLRQGGIALATVLASMLNNTILLMRLRREGFALPGRLLAASFGRVLLASVLSGAVLVPVYPFLQQLLTVRWLGEFPAFLLLCSLFGLGYLWLCRLFGCPEPREFFGSLLQRRSAK